MKTGIILSIDSHESVVLDKSINQKFTCYAKGNVKKLNKSPIVGDYVEYEKINQNQYIIIKILDRKTEIYRPKIANVDQAMIVTSVKEPNMSTFLLNKYIVFLEVNLISSILIFTKIDLLKTDDKELDVIKAYDDLGYKVLKTDNKAENNETFLSEIEKMLSNKFSIFVGQTGAGKSTTLNNFLSFEEQQSTNEISTSLNRGKHTTTKVKTFYLKNNILLADSPGFSSFSLKNIQLDQAAYALKPFENYRNQCKFNNCLHVNENGCSIKNAVEKEEIPNFMYQDYLKIVDEIKKENKEPWKNTH